MATSSSGLSSIGVGSGLDVNSMISSLMAVERKPLDGMKADATKINTKLSAYGKLQSYVSALGDAASKLSSSTTWAQTTAASSDDAKVSATAGTDAVAGSYNVQITALASAQSVSSAAHADPAIGAGLGGTLRIEMGSYNGDKTSFTPINYPSWVDIAISTSDSLQAIRDKINTAGSGVTASIVTDSSGSRLILRSKATGAESAFRVSVTDDDGNNEDASGLSSLAYDPTASVSNLTLNKDASNATAEIDGLTVTSKTNTFTDTLQGVSFVAKSLTTAPITLTVSSDTKAMTDAVNAFATAYNDLASYLAAQTKYDGETKTAGSLQGDAGANALRSALRSLGNGSSGASSVFDRLSEIGLDPQANGTLKVNSAKLSSAVAKPDELRQLFGGNDLASTTDDGFGTRINDWARGLLSIDGAVATRQASLKSQLRANDKEQADFQERMTTVQARLTAQYQSLDTQMSRMTALSNYVTQQIANWNKSSG